MKNIIYIVSAYIILNIVGPIIINSIDRVYGRQIDVGLKQTVYFLKLLFLRLYGIFLLILFLPAVIETIIIKKIQPQFYYRFWQFTFIKKLNDIIMNKFR